MKNGIILIDKPQGMTSHDVVDAVRKKFSMRRVGHAGTLDPLATGVLIVLLGKSTKLFNKFMAFDKTYEATLLLGRRTDTADIEGKTLAQTPVEGITSAMIENVFQQFSGDIQQVPPMYSAVKIKGRKLYQLARSGIEVEREPRAIKIYSLKLLQLIIPEVKFFLQCSKGTYVRQLAEDVGEALGCGACISQIQRTRVGPFALPEAVALEGLDERYIRQWPV